MSAQNVAMAVIIWENEMVLRAPVGVLGEAEESGQVVEDVGDIRVGASVPRLAHRQRRPQLRLRLEEAPLPQPATQSKTMEQSATHHPEYNQGLGTLGLPTDKLPEYNPGTEQLSQPATYNTAHPDYNPGIEPLPQPGTQRNHGATCNTSP